MRLIGLTGGIASGKSTAARWLAARGVPVLDADQVARQVLAPGTPLLARLAQALAPRTVLDPSGALDRPALRQALAEDPEVKRVVDQLTHPAIREEIAKWLANLPPTTPLAVVEAALMVETGSWRSYPERLVVTCDPDLQRRRVRARDGSPDEVARALLARQATNAEREAAATWVLRNDGSLVEFERALARWADAALPEISLAARAAPTSEPGRPAERDLAES